MTAHSILGSPVRWLILAGLFHFAVSGYSQTVKVIGFSEMQNILNQRNDTTYVVNFWATWCGPCVGELPGFEEAGRELKNDKVRMLLVSMDDAEDLATKVVPFTIRKNIVLPVYLLNDRDYNRWMPKIDKSWSGAIPATLVWHRNSRKFYEQPLTKTELLTAIHQIKK
jgi:thiol-disulfide isomerase/thioredoxin